MFDSKDPTILEVWNVAHEQKTFYPLDPLE